MLVAVAAALALGAAAEAPCCNKNWLGSCERNGACPGYCHNGVQGNVPCYMGSYASGGGAQCWTDNRNAYSCGNGDGGGWHCRCPNLARKGHHAGWQQKGDTPCSPGYYADVEGLSACKTCAAGYYSHSGYTTCSKCAGGSVSAARSSSCSQCGRGTYDNGHNQCARCAAGTYVSGSGATHCSNCPAGSYSGTGASGCARCPAGKYSRAGASGCSTCNPGSASGAGASGCSQCGAGTYSGAGSSRCTTCPHGTISAAGATSCHACPAGTYSSDGRTCHQCPCGTFSAAGAASCRAADAGHYTGVSGATAQFPCPGGAWSAGGACTCQLCAAGTTTPRLGATSAAECASCPSGGVEPFTYTCRGSAVGIDDPCWDAAQLQGLANSRAAHDVRTIMLQGDAGVLRLIDDLVAFVARSAQAGGVTGASKVTANESDAMVQRLNASDTLWAQAWFQAGGGREKCLANPPTAWQSSPLRLHQFGASLAASRVAWEMRWLCEGATFGCSEGDCPQGASCFEPVKQLFMPMLRSGSGPTAFATDPSSRLGRSAPPYSAAFLAGSSLSANVRSLLEWQDAVTQHTYQQSLQESVTSGVEDLLRAADALDANQLKLLEGQSDLRIGQSNIKATVTAEVRQAAQAILGVSKAEAEQRLSVYNGQLSTYGAMIESNWNSIQEGKEGIGTGPKSMRALLNQCEIEIAASVFLDLLASSADLFSELGEVVKEDWKQVVKLQSAIFVANTLYTLYNTIESFKSVEGVTTIAAIHPPDVDQLKSPDPATRRKAHANAAFLQSLGEKLGSAFKEYDAAAWRQVYLDQEKLWTPVLDDPLDCTETWPSIKSAIHTYLIDVRGITNNGESMFSAAINYINAAGQASVGQAALNAATSSLALYAPAPAPDDTDGGRNPKPVAALVAQPRRLQSAPSNFQAEFSARFDTTFTADTKMIAAAATALYTLSRQYTVSTVLSHFCASYAYSHAGRVYRSPTGDADCYNFGKYLPGGSAAAPTAFSDTVANIAAPGNSLVQPPLYQSLAQRQQCFTDTVLGDPEVFGAPATASQRGAVQGQVLQLILSTDDVRGYSGDLSKGRISFELAPNSPLLFSNGGDKLFDPITTLGANPRLFDVKAYWRGPFNDLAVLSTSVSVGGSQQVFGETGYAYHFNMRPWDAFATTTVKWMGEHEASAGGELQCAGSMSYQAVRFPGGKSVGYCSSATASNAISAAGSPWLYPGLWAHFSVETALWEQALNATLNSTLHGTELLLELSYIASDGAGSGAPTWLDTCSQQCMMLEAKVGGGCRGDNAFDAVEWCNCPVGVCPADGSATSINGACSQRCSTKSACACNVFGCQCTGCEQTGSCAPPPANPPPSPPPPSPSPVSSPPLPLSFSPPLPATSPTSGDGPATVDGEDIAESIAESIASAGGRRALLQASGSPAACSAMAPSRRLLAESEPEAFADVCHEYALHGVANWTADSLVTPHHAPLVDALLLSHCLERSHLEGVAGIGAILFSRLDADGNGRISCDEFVQHHGVEGRCVYPKSTAHAEAFVRAHACYGEAMGSNEAIESCTALHLAVYEANEKGGFDRGSAAIAGIVLVVVGVVVAAVFVCTRKRNAGVGFICTRLCDLFSCC